ncbi:MAG: hypothetical protein FWB85_11220, partial [Chitinispirillia bacterium]|nr:hypothetical protein [Chitinispirillia bacterium]
MPNNNPVESIKTAVMVTVFVTNDENMRYKLLKRGGRMNRHFKLKCSAAILCVMTFLAYSQMNYNLSDAEVIKKAELALKRYPVMDTAELDINRLMRAIWHQNGAYLIIYSFEDDRYKPVDVYISLPFIVPPYRSYWEGGPKSHIVEKFMKQINEKLSNKIPLI